MFLELVRRLSKLDDSLALSLNLSQDGVWTISIDVLELGYIYSFSSTDIAECYSRVNKYLDCLNDEEKFEELVSEILDEGFEVKESC